MLGFDAASVLGVHPDLIRSRTRLLETNKRYFLYEGSAYLLHASVIPVSALTTTFAGRLFSNEDPDRDEGDVNLGAVDSQNQTPLIPTYYHQGVYIETAGTGSETALVTVFYIRREDYAAAFPAAECKLVAAWDADPCARGAYHENWDTGIPERGQWANDGGVPGDSTNVGEIADNIFRVIGSGDITKKLAFEVDGITTATTRTVTMPDADVNLSDAARAASLLSENPIPSVTVMRTGTSTTAGTMTSASVASSNRQSGAGAPSSTPEDEGLLYTDTTGGQQYVSIGTTSSDDWEQIIIADTKHTAINSDDHALEIDVNAAGFGDVKAIDLDYITGAIAGGQDEAVILVNIDESAATGGVVVGVEVLTTEGSATIYGMLAAALVNPIKQLSGTFGDMDEASVKGVDRLTEFTTAGGGNDIQMFVDDNDPIIVGDLAKFEELEFLLATVASGAGIAPTFEFSTGEGTWTTFTPVDGTNGMRNSGVIAWLDSDIPTWAVGTSSPDHFLIRITRTRNSLSTPPTESLVQIAAITEFGWDASADLTVHDIAPTGTVDGRDVATDGTKLDAIESSATADQSDAEIKTAYENGTIVTTRAAMRAGTDTTIRSMTPQRVKNASLLTVVSKTTTYTATVDDQVILCDATSGAFTVTLPAVSAIGGVQFWIKKVDVSGNAITIDGNGAETIDNVATKTLSGAADTLHIVTNGTAWLVLASH